jgi:hypothetical protein
MYEHTADVDFTSQEPHHQLTVCVTGGAANVGLNISHALVGAQSVSILLRDLELAYDSRLAEGQGPYYGDYIFYLRSLNPGLSAEHWREYLSGVPPCILPRLDYQSLDEECLKGTRTVEVDMDGTAELERFCAQEGVTVSTVFQLAWALVLRCFAQTDDVCFGYVSAGRGIALDHLEDAVGPYINTMITRVHFGRGRTVREELQAILNDFIKNSPHQYAPLGQVLSGLNLSGPLFNTAISVRRPSSHRAGNACP